MSISNQINVSTLGGVATNQNMLEVSSVTSPTGILGVVSETNPDFLSDTGVYSVVINVPCPVYQGTLNSASLTFYTRRSDIYNTVGNRPAFAVVNSENDLFDLQEDAPQNGMIAGDYAVFATNDNLSDYEAGDKALWNGSPAPDENAWTRYPLGTDIDVPITPTNPVGQMSVKVDAEKVPDGSPAPASVRRWLNMDRTTSNYIYNIPTSSFVDIDITDIVKEVTDLPQWEKNNTINIVFEIQDNSLNYLFDMGVTTNPNVFILNTDNDPVVPFPPTNLQITSEYRALIFSWDAPIDDGGSPITSYNYEYKESDSSDWTTTNGTTASVTTATVEGLDPSKYYYLRVRANNAVGRGAWNTLSTPAAPNNNAPVPIGSLDFNSANPIRVRIRRDYSAAWDAADPVLAIGEPGYDLDTHFLKVGDGLTSWTGLNTIEVPDSTINFPSPPDVFLNVKNNEFASDPSVTCNLSQNIPLTLKAGQGLTADYDDVYKSVIFSLQATFDPIISGTVVNPESSGVPGQVKYDNERMFFCVEDNLWKRVLQDQPWFNLIPISVSNSLGQYPSRTDITADGSVVQVTSNGDPYPALAGTPLVNDGLTPRGGFLGGYIPNSQNYNFIILYKGGESTSNPQVVFENSPIAVTVNGVVIKPSQYSGDIDAFSPPAGFDYDKPFWGNYFGFDDCTGHVASDLVYVYYGGGFVSKCWRTSKFYQSNSYFNDTNFSGDNIRHTDGHSKIVGIAFDGYPIYGPFGYADPLDTSTTARRMVSSYRKLPSDIHRPIGRKYTDFLVIEDVNYPLSAGAYVQDYEYNSSYGDLDEYNGRYCKTPDYPNGTYAYFLTFADDNLDFPAYPYIIGTSTREQRSVL